MEKSKRCTILVNSCDTYDDLWEPFFKLFSIYWHDCPYNIVLNTESKTFSYNGLDIKTYSRYKPGNKIPWGKRFRFHLSKIETEYVLILLDDFFLQNNPDTAKIEKIIDCMANDKSIASFTFGEAEDKNNITFPPFPEFYQRPAQSRYKYNLQAGIWKTRELLSAIKPFESPWEWETTGNIRSFNDGKKYLTLKDSKNTNIIQYGFSYNGAGGIFRGKWVLDNVDELFKKHEIIVDYSKREIFYSFDHKNKKTILELLIKKWRLLRSLEFMPKYIKYYKNIYR